MPEGTVEDGQKARRQGPFFQTHESEVRGEAEPTSDRWLAVLPTDVEKQGIGLQIRIEPFAEPAKVLQHAIEGMTSWNSPTLLEAGTLLRFQRRKPQKLFQRPLLIILPDCLSSPLRLLASRFNRAPRRACRKSSNVGNHQPRLSSECLGGVFTLFRRQTWLKGLLQHAWPSRARRTISSIEEYRMARLHFFLALCLYILLLVTGCATTCLPCLRFASLGLRFCPALTNF